MPTQNWYNPIPWIMPQTLWGAVNFFSLPQQQRQTLWDAINFPLQLVPYEDALEQSWAHGGEYAPPPLPGEYVPGKALRDYWDTMGDSVKRTQRNVDRIRQGK